MDNKKHIKLFFICLLVYSIIGLITITFEGKTNTEILNELFYRQMYCFVIAISQGFGMMAGISIFIYIKKKMKKNE